MFAFCCLRSGVESSEEILSELRQEVRQSIGPFATPKHVVLVADLPKTRSGKVMRRILQKLATGTIELESLGDLSTLSNPRCGFCAVFLSVLT